MSGAANTAAAGSPEGWAAGSADTSGGPPGAPAASGPVSGGVSSPAISSAAPGSGGADTCGVTASASGGASGPAAGGSASGPHAPANGNLPPIQVGTYYLNGGNAALAQAGFGGLVIPDNKPVFDAFVKYVNAHGGLGGRQIQPVYYQYSEGQDPVAQDQAACAAFTQDHHVYMVIGGISSGAGDLLPCLANKNVPLIGAATQGDLNYFEQYHRYSYEPDELNLTSGLQLLIANLQTRGYLAGIHSVGVVQYPGQFYDNAVTNGLIPALKKVGLSLTDRETLSSTTDNGSIASGSTNAELRFSTEHIGLVLFVSPGGAAETYFMNTAQTQGYKPKYGIWSSDSPYVLATTAPKAQLAGSIGVGYLPGLDVASAQDPTASTPAGKTCLALGTSLGLDESGLGNGLVRAACDVFLIMQRAMNADPAATSSTAALEQAIDSIGASFSAASTFAINWRSGHHDAAGGYRNLAYDSGCSCFEYSGATQLIP